MKVYFIYRKYKEDGYKNPSSLYAFTKYKELKDEFMKVRDNNQFFVVKKFFEPDDYLKFMNEHYNYLLGERNYRNSDNDIVKIISTCGEELDVFIKSDKILDELMRYVDEFSCAYNKTLREALNILNYDAIKRYKRDTIHHYYDFYEDKDYDIKVVENLKPNQAGMFAYLFGNTFNVNKL